METLNSVEMTNSKTMAVASEESQNDHNSGFGVSETTQPLAEANDSSIMSKSFSSCFSDIESHGIRDDSSAVKKGTVSQCSNDLSICRRNNLIEDSFSKNISINCHNILNNSSELIRAGDGVSCISGCVAFNENNKNNEVRSDENEKSVELRLQERDSIDEELLADKQKVVKSKNAEHTGKRFVNKDDNNPSSDLSSEMYDSVEPLSKDVCDSFGIDETINKDHEDSSPPLGIDETSLNLSETGGGSGSDCEQTGFLQCDTGDAQESEETVMDVIEVNAVDPFAQTIDSERCETSQYAGDTDNAHIENNVINISEVINEDVTEMDITKPLSDKVDEKKSTEESSSDKQENESVYKEVTTKEAREQDKNLTEILCKDFKNVKETEDNEGEKTGGKLSISESKEIEEADKADANDEAVNCSGEKVVDQFCLNESRLLDEKCAENSNALDVKTVNVVNKDEDLCIIPDTEPRVPPNHSSNSKLRSILKRISPTNAISEDDNSEDRIRDYPVVSSRPQRQAAKKADAQIKAAVQQLDDDVEKENDDVEEASVTILDCDNAKQLVNAGQVCQQCCRLRICKLKILSQGKTMSYLCSEACSQRYQSSMNDTQTERIKHISDADTSKESHTVEPNDSTCDVNNTSANEVREPHLVIKHTAEVNHNLNNIAISLSEPTKQIRDLPVKQSPLKRPARRLNEDGEFVRICSECCSDIKQDERTLSWETMDFCNEGCLGKYQTSLGSYCAYCKKSVQQVSLGKYCVRFGYDIRQFCCASCLEEFKKGLKVCSYCQKDISSSVEGFLAPVGDKGQFKDFCTQSCMEKYDQMSSNQRPPPQMYPCDVCKNKKIVEVEVLMESKINKLCSGVCFAAFKFVNTIKVDQCDMCRKYFDRANCSTENFSVYYEDAQHNFCCKTCMNVYILAKRKIVPCNWCKVKKYNFDMIKRVLDTKQVLMMCSLNCLTLYQVSINAVSSRRIRCDSCSSITQAQYHLTMSDATIRNFCNYNCVMKFQAQYNKSPITLPASQPIPTGGPKRVVPVTSPSSNDTSGVPVISSVTSLAAGQSSIVAESSALEKQINGGASGPVPVSLSTASTATPAPPGENIISGTPYHVVMKPQQPIKISNKITQCRPYMHTKGVSCKPHACMKETQTDCDYNPDGNKVLIPVPVPIYIPAPMHMFTLPIPTPMPIPLPIPVPIFIPTTRGSAKGIMQEIKKIEEKMPTDPFEAELLMMAAMVADDKKPEETSSESDDDQVDTAEPAGNTAGTDNINTTQADDISGPGDGTSSFTTGEVMETNSNTFGTEDMLQMALKMATEMDDQSNSSTAVDLEAELPPSTITPAQSVSSSRSNHTDDGENEEDVDEPQPVTRESRGRKRVGRPPGRKTNCAPPAKRSRKSSSASSNIDPAPPQTVVQIPVEKPDANMCLKFTFGVNAWKQWVIAKNAELEKISAPGNNNSRKVKLFKTDILQLTADELNYSLCLFVKEARKPNGSTYAPDTIFYFCLGIQQYLFENGRIDNIFTDSYYEKFTECLDEVGKIFSDISDDSKLIVTRVEEEHLWECKQLGAHSPHVLLSTLMFFNTKHFNLTNVDEHMQLSFSHIMKHWKRNPNQPGLPASGSSSKAGSRNVLLRFYPPQTSSDSPKKKKVYEQQENEENPLRCPVKLYEFYLSKCPESVKTRNDVFYLLPERSCVPDSPVWYSTMALSQEPLMKMLNRIKMVKEVNIALRST